MVDKSGKEIAVVSDIHVAKSWDRIEMVVGDRIKFLNPNRELRTLVEKLNNSSEVGAVVFNGDLVDYYFASREEESDTSDPQETNWDLFNDMVSKLNMSNVQTLGNHDFRKDPYSYWIYGLSHVNVPEKLRKELIDEIGHHRFTWFNELSALAVSEGAFDPLQKYTGTKDPTEMKIGDRNCLFLNTGSDAYVRPRNWLKFIGKSVLGRRPYNDCDGLTNQDIKFVQEKIRKNGDVCVFMHAPVINPQKSQLGIEYQLSESHFLASVTSQGLGDRVILNNGGELLKTLRDSNENSIIVASHTHSPNYFLIDKENFRAREVDNSEFNERRNDSRYIKQLITLPLGAIPRKGERKIGYLAISQDGFKEVVVDSY